MSGVTQSWVRALPWKMQSILFSGLRGPDGVRARDVKVVCKWMRASSQKNADPSKPYMQNGRLPDFDDVLGELETLPCHYVHHFADALRVVAHGHFDEGTRDAALELHCLIAEEIFHFIPEHPAIFAWRHRDKPEGVDPEPEPPLYDRAWMGGHLPEGYTHR